jgi:nitroreductase
MNRREFFGTAGLAALAMGALGLEGAVSQGLAAQAPGRGAGSAAGKSLEAALRARQSQRAYSPEPLAEALLLDLLWSACGVNRPDGRRTAPTALNRQEVEVHVIRAEGHFLYDAQAGTLVRKSGQDLRRLAGTQAYAATAPVNLVYVADMDRVAGNGPEEKILTAGLDTGYISQNVYLFCAAAGLATVARASLDAPALGKALGLAPRQRITLAQSVGHPKA